MHDLNLSGRDTRALRALMAAEPVPGQPLPDGNVLTCLDTLVPCDYLGATYVDATGLVSAQHTMTPPARGRGKLVVEPDLHEQHGGPFYIGVMHWRRYPMLAEGCGVVLNPRQDAWAVGFRNGTDHVVQYWFRRDARHFTGRELALLHILGPVFQRLCRERPTPSLPASLTIAERRILNEVAGGYSNAEIAEGNHVTVSTVRKHLENAYRKLGVTSRMAAIARLRGSDDPGLDLRERVDRYA
jgi:DNA-binding CsgD family transcriptional regulator